MGIIIYRSIMGGMSRVENTNLQEKTVTLRSYIDQLEDLYKSISDE